MDKAAGDVASRQTVRGVAFLWYPQFQGPFLLISAIMASIRVGGMKFTGPGSYRYKNGRHKVAIEARLGKKPRLVKKSSPSPESATFAPVEDYQHNFDQESFPCESPKSQKERKTKVEQLIDE
jgi:hypothetical protein